MAEKSKKTPPEKNTMMNKAKFVSINERFSGFLLSAYNF